jgi:hypothetical protein
VGFSPDDSDAIFDACHSFLAAEQSTPGSVIVRLLASRSGKVRSVADEIQARGGEGWSVTEGAAKNMIVMTALMSMRRIGPGRA